MARLSRYDKILAFLFVLSLPLVNPWVRGDGVGYYAFGRALLIQHDLNFQQDWLRANSSFRSGRTDERESSSDGVYVHGPRGQSFFDWARDSLVSIFIGRPSLCSFL